MSTEWTVEKVIEEAAKPSEVEEWRAVPGFEERYEVSNLGRVRGWYMPTRNASQRRKAPVVLRVHLSSNKYYFRVRLCDGTNGKGASRYVHNIVLEAFVGPRPKGHQGAHLNGNPVDNRLANLEWQTVSENNKAKVQHGRVPRGERRSHFKLSDDKVREIRRRKASGDLGYVIANELGVDKTTVYRVLRGECWDHVV